MNLLTYVRGIDAFVIYQAICNNDATKRQRARARARVKIHVLLIYRYCCVSTNLQVN